MKRLLATLLAAGMVLSVASCGKEPEKTDETTAVPTTTAAETEPQGWAGSYQSTDTDEHFTIYDVTDKGFKVEFYHYEEDLIERFDYEMEYDDESRALASQVGSMDDNGGWEYCFGFGGSRITVTWQGKSMVYERVS
jgi:hypothetical protein